MAKIRKKKEFRIFFKKTNFQPSEFLVNSEIVGKRPPKEAQVAEATAQVLGDRGKASNASPQASLIS